MSLFAMIGLGVTWVILVCQPHVPPEELGEPATEPSSEPPREAIGQSRLPPSLASPSRAVGWIGTLLLGALFTGLLLVEVYETPLRHAPRAAIPLLLFFLLILAASSVVRESDHAIIEAIHEERHTARRVALTELLLLLPAILCGAVGLWLMLPGGDLPHRVGDALHTQIHVPGLALLRHWMPFHGFATAAAGFVLAGALGWAIRIVFTLLFGKEAFGTGDIHLMSAAGAVAGWPVVVLGFFLTCLVAMMGWILTLPFKRTRALPLGPWLSWSILAVVIFYEPMMNWPPMARALTAFRWLFLRDADLGGMDFAP
jgi:prepilin signal peptidase PulO-like enzyme (type II secretory pathway)